MTQPRTYSPRCRVGNWCEDVVLREDILKDFMEQRSRGELTLQKVGVLRDNLTKSVELSVSQGNLCFGDTIMLINPGEETSPCGPCALTLIVDVNKNGPQPSHTEPQSLQGPCAVSGAKILQPIVSNTFVIESVDGSSSGQVLHYNQPFCLRTTSGFAGGLYLASDIKSFQKCALKSRLQEVNLVEGLSFLCHWRVHYLDPKRRVALEGYPVAANSKVLISHCKTNQYLALLDNHSLWTPYGKVYEVTAHTMLDSHKAERHPNHWMFASADPGNRGQTLFQTLLASTEGEPAQLDAGGSHLATDTTQPGSEL